jgi:hypothetical protein
MQAVMSFGMSSPGTISLGAGKGPTPEGIAVAGLATGPDQID